MLKKEKNKTKDAHNGVGHHSDLQSRRTLDHHSSIASVSSSTHSNVSSATESERHEVARNREMRSSSSARKPVPDEVWIWQFCFYRDVPTWVDFYLCVFIYTVGKEL